jgi:hypothetical protein
MSTGTALNAITTYNSVSETGVSQYDIFNYQPAIEPELQAAAVAAGYRQVLYDQVTLQFDIIPTASGRLGFQYVFASEEYPQYAPSPCELTTSRQTNV